MPFPGRDFISVNQLDRQILEILLALARRMKPIMSRQERCNLLDGYILGNLFFEASTRTRMSFASAFMRLGGQVNSTTGVTFSSMAKGETLADTISVIQAYCDIIVIRHSLLGAAGEAARFSSVPVINAGDGVGEHPTQALLDLYTIFDERGRVDGVKIAMVGDLKMGRTVHSLAKLLTNYEDVEFTFIAPEMVQMPESLVREIRSMGFKVSLTDDFKSGIHGADVVYMTRIQEERFEKPEDFAAIKDIYILDRATIGDCCKEDALILHPLPRMNEMPPEVDGLPNVAHFRQSANGVLVRMALYLLLLGKEGYIK